MALIHILSEFMSRVGLQPTAAQKQLAIGIINKAAKDIYDSPTFEPLSCLREQIFQFEDVTEQLFTFPWNVGSIKAMRDVTNGFRAGLVDMRARYQTQGWQDKYAGGWTFRLRNESPLAKSYDNEAPFILALPEPASETFNVYLSGSSERAAKERETVSFAVGDTQKVTIRSYEEIHAIVKDALTTCDVYILDADGNELGKIPNHLYNVVYQTVQIPESVAIQTAANTTFVECCYKHVFVPMRSDYDTFIVEGYDDAIYWKALEHWYSKKEGKLAEVTAARAKAAEVITNLQIDKETGTQKKIDFTPNPYYGLHDIGCGDTFYY